MQKYQDEGPDPAQSLLLGPIHHFRGGIASRNYPHQPNKINVYGIIFS
jgi:hypothetical protein